MGWEQLSYEASEAAGTVTVCAILTGQIERDVSVNVSSSDGSAIGRHKFSDFTLFLILIGFLPHQL